MLRKRNSNPYTLVTGIVFIALIVSFFLFHADVRGDEEGFFSYRRFFLNDPFVGKSSRGSQTERELERFMKVFTSGVYDISAGRLDEAEREMIEARHIWPEFYGTDFLLAGIYEEKGSALTAARYYKSYLNKLKALESGKYRISFPVIRNIMPGGVERYADAHMLVEDRLRGYGVSLDNVRPAVMSSRPVIIMLAMTLIFASYEVLKHMVWPRMKLNYRIKHPPEGFWVCRKCGADNPNTAIECQECRRPRKGGA